MGWRECKIEQVQFGVWREKGMAQRRPRTSGSTKVRPVPCSAVRLSIYLAAHVFFALQHPSTDRLRGDGGSLQVAGGPITAGWTGAEPRPVQNSCGLRSMQRANGGRDSRRSAGRW